MSDRRFACADYTGGRVLMVSEKQGVLWQYPAEQCNDLTLLENGNLLFNAGHSVLEVTPDKKVVFRYDSRSRIYACQRLENGNTFVGECNAGRLLEVSPSGEIVKQLRLVPEGTDAGSAYMRNARRLPNGNYLVAHYGADVVKEYDPTGRLVLEIAAPGGPHSVARLPDGHTLISCGDHAGGPRLFEVDAAGEVVWQVKEGDLEGVSLKFLAGFQRLPNGNVLVANWLGHGNLGQSAQLIEVSRDKRVVWQYSNPAAITTVSSIQLVETK